VTDGNHTIVPLSDLINIYGDNLKNILIKFVPYSTNDASLFLTKQAVQMEKRDLSRTYLAFSDIDGSILGFVTIGLKCIRIPEENNLSRSLLKQCNIERSTGVAQAYLIGQLARSADSPKGFGERLMQYAIDKLRDAKGIVGCRMARLDCADELIGYYERYEFNQIRKDHHHGLNQMMILI